jgi:hypothetical protein
VGTALLIWAGGGTWLGRKLLANRGLVFVGLISYPLYLWHWPLLSFARIMESETPSRGIRYAAVGLAFLLAWATYRFVETPLRKPAAGPARLRVHAAGLLVAMAAVGLAGLAVFKLEGVGSRVDSFAALNSQFKYAAEANQALCQERYPFTRDGHCVGYVPGQAARAAILIIGDSHAEAFSRGLALQARSLLPEREVLAMGRGGCLPLLGVETWGRAGARGCPEVNAAIFEHAVSDAGVRTVALSARYAFRVSEGGFGPIEAGVRNHIQRPGPKTEERAYPQVFEAGLRATLDRLLAAGKEVVFIHQVPELGFDPRSCAGLRPLRLAKSDRPTCSVPREAVEARQRAYRAIVNSVLRDYPSVREFDPLPHLCDERECHAVRDGRMLYRDGDHLSIDGSLELARRFAAR